MQSAALDQIPISTDQLGTCWENTNIPWALEFIKELPSNLSSGKKEFSDAKNVISRDTQ